MRVKIGGGLLWSRNRTGYSTIHRWVRGSGGAGSVLCSLTDGRSQVSGEIKNELAMYDHVVVGLFEVAREHFISTSVQVDDRPYADVDDAEESLVLLLEFLLVEDLDRENAFFVHSHVEALVPVGVQRLLDDARGARLLAIDRGHGKWVRKAEDIALVKPISGNDGDAQVGLPASVHDAR